MSIAGGDGEPLIVEDHKVQGQGEYHDLGN